MKLPDGIPQSSACMLIALREYFNDPTWEDAELIATLQDRNMPDKLTARSGETWGYPTDRTTALFQRNGLFAPDTITFAPQSSNGDEIEVVVDKKLRYSFPRNASAILIYYTNKESTSGHAVHLPLHVAFCFLVNCRYGWAYIGIDPADMQFLGVKQ